MAKSNRKKRKKALMRTFFTFFCFISVVIFGYFYSWPVFIRIQAPAEQVKGISAFLRSVNGRSILSSVKITQLDWSELKAPITHPTLHRRVPFCWSLHFSEKYQSRYVCLNQTIREVDIEGKLLSPPDQQTVQASSLLFYYPVEIQSTQTSIDEVYEKEVAPLIAYLYRSMSGLSPKVRNIQYSPDKGLVLTIFQKFCWVGFISDKPDQYIQEIEKKILRLEEYIEAKSSWDEFNQFDLRFDNQIICRKHQ